LSGVAGSYQVTISRTQVSILPDSLKKFNARPLYWLGKTIYSDGLTQRIM